MRSVEAEGGTIDEAIANALSMLRAAREQVEIEILANATRGVLGFGGKPARVRATVRESLGSPVSRGPREMRAQEILAEILRHMGADCTVERRPDHEPGIVALAVHGSDSGLVIGRHGQTLDALEYLLNRIVARGEDGAPRVVIDVERYRERRCEALEPMSPRDRRVVHLALQGDPAVTTRSQGDGHFRRLLIIPQGRLRRDETPEPRGR